MLMGAF